MKRYIKQLILLGLFMFVGIVFFGGLGDVAVKAATQQDLLVMSSVIGGIGFQYSSGVANVLTKVVPDVRVTMEATSGYIDNAKRLYAGYGDLGIVSHDTARAVYLHEQGFEEKGTPLVAIAPIHILYWNIIVNQDSPIKSIWDLEGKRVNVQPKGSSAESTASALFNAIKVNIKASYYQHSEAAEGMRSGSIDAHWQGGSNPVWMEYAVRKPVRVIEFSDEDIAKIRQDLPYLSPVVFPAEDYYEGAGNVQVLGTWAVLMCRQDLSEDLVYEITKGLYEKKDIMLAAHPGAKDMSLERVLDLTIPLHPGAIKYYEEKGIKIPDQLIP
jgi:TRAP transporter TAXI family solute receptor